MLFGCSKVRLVLKWSYANKFSLVDTSCHMTSLYLCWKTFLKTRFLSKSLGKGILLLCCKKTMVNHTWPFPNSSAVPSRYSEPHPCHDRTLQVLRPAQTPFFWKHFMKPKLDIGQCSDLYNRPWPRTRLFEYVYTLQRLYTLPTRFDKSAGIPPQTVIHKYVGFG
jgi:hypothetical protein